MNNRVLNTIIHLDQYILTVLLLFKTNLILFKIAVKWERKKLQKLNEITYIGNLNIIMVHSLRATLVSGRIDIISEDNSVNSQYYI